MKRELRASVQLVEERGSVGRLTGVLIETGRVASDRREVFVPGSVKWPAEGVDLLHGHGGEKVLSFAPKVDGSEIRIDEPLPDTILGRKVREEVKSGSRSSLSVEFFSLAESVVSSVREIRSALVEAVALVADGSYKQAVVEVRAKRKRHRWR